LAPDLFLSQKFRRLSFLGMITVVYVHAFNFDDRYLWAGRPFTEELNFENFIQVFITNGLLRFGVPLFFFRAGYLMAETDAHYSFLSRLVKKLKTLVMPYCAWGLLGVLVTYLFESQAFLEQFVISAQLGKYGISVHEWSPEQWFSGVFLDQISFQLWFLRSLFIYSLLYPLLVLATQKWPWILLALFAACWILGIGFVFVEGEGILFFTIGIVAQKHNWNFKAIAAFTNKFYLWIPTLILVSLKAWLSFQEGNIQICWFMHSAQQLLLLLTFWGLYDISIGKTTKHIWLDKASRYNFFIYGFHVPILYYLTDLTFFYLGKESMTRLGVFICLPLLLVAFSMLWGWILDKVFPKAFWVLTGGRI